MARSVFGGWARVFILFLVGWCVIVGGVGRCEEGLCLKVVPLFCFPCVKALVLLPPALLALASLALALPVLIPF